MARRLLSSIVDNDSDVAPNALNCYVVEAGASLNALQMRTREEGPDLLEESATETEKVRDSNLAKSVA